MRVSLLVPLAMTPVPLNGVIRRIKKLATGFLAASVTVSNFA
jgi:hypothetical protein